MVEELYQKASGPISETSWYRHAFHEIVCPETEQLHLLLIMDVVRIYEVEEYKGQQNDACCLD